MIFLAALSGASYHFLTKTLPPMDHPFASLTISYLVSAAVCLILTVLMRSGEGVSAAFKTLNLRSALVGVALVGIEAGIFFLYKLGGAISAISVLIAAVQAIVLLFLGYLVLREQIGVANIGGIFVVLLGIFLLTRKP